MAGSVLHVQPLTVWAEDRDRLHRAIDSPEPVRCPGRKLNRFTGFDGEIAIAENQSQPAGKHVQPFLTIVHRQFGGRNVTARADPDLEGVQPARRPPAGQWPIGDAVAAVRGAAHPRVVGLRRTHQFIGADRQRRGKTRKVIEGKSTLTGFQPAQRRDIDIGRARNILQRHAALGAQFPQPPPDPRFDVLGLALCLHGKSAWHLSGTEGKLDGMDNEWECVVVGGGAAGLSAALMLGRARRRTLVVDAGEPSNRVAPGIGGLLGQDGRPPHEFYADARNELAKYESVRIVMGQVTAAARGGDGFRVELDAGAVHNARRLILATGMRYEYPEVPGLESLWGNSVFHCPFCHGWEARDQPLAVLAQGDRAVHMALLLNGWTDDIVVLTNGPAGLAADQHDLLVAAGIGVDDREIAEFISNDGTLTAVAFADGSELKRAGALVATSLHQRSTLPTQLGVQLAPPGPAVQDAVVVDQFFRTSVPGVFAAGDICFQMPQVATAIASGSAAGAAVVQSLLSDQVGLPVPPWPETAQQHWENRYAQKDQFWSGQPNAHLPTVAKDLTPGRALDLGCGEGGDAVWLANNGWQVVAVDIATNALQRSRTAAAAAGVEDRIDFQQHDLSDSFPDGVFDLVSAQFLHSTVRLERPQILTRAAAAVQPGGTLLIVDHGEAPPWADEHVRHHVFQSADEVVAELDLSDQWQVEHAGPVSRDGVGPDGQPATMTDNLIILRRR